MYPNDGIAVTPGSGATAATHSPQGSNGTEYQVMMLAHSSGHLADTQPTYMLTIPPLSVGANSYPWELFNGASSGKTLTVRGIWPVTDSAVAKTGALSAAYHFYRTTTKSSGGTNCTYESSATLAPNFFRMNPGDSVLSSAISCKTALTSISTGVALFPAYVFTEETNVATLLQQYFNLIPTRHWGQELVVPAGTGIAARQGPIASVGSVGWLVEFTLDP